MAALTVHDLDVEYRSNGYRIQPFDGFEMEAEDGELVVLLGPSGCGKTTLLSCIAGLLVPSAGSIRVGDVEVTALAGAALTSYRREVVGIVFQAFNLVRSLTARENVMAPLLLSGSRRAAAAGRADELLARVGLTDRARHRPSSLSGGQQQRVAIARALAHDPPLLLADEPTAHLDHIQVEGVLTILRELATPGRMVLVSTHDDRVTRLADRVVELAPRGAEPMATEPYEMVLAEGEALFSQGDYGTDVYVVEAGRIALFHVLEDGSRENITVVESGSYFGELAPLLQMPRSCSAAALTPARLTAYPMNEFSRRFPSISDRMRAGSRTGEAEGRDLT